MGHSTTLASRAFVAVLATLLSAGNVICPIAAGRSAVAFDVLRIARSWVPQDGQLPGGVCVIVCARCDVGACFHARAWVDKEGTLNEFLFAPDYRASCFAAVVPKQHWWRDRWPPSAEKTRYHGRHL